jgi:uncharacterized protein
MYATSSRDGGSHARTDLLYPSGDCGTVAQLRAAEFRGRTRLLVLQGTSFCNINCSYCYLPGRDVRSRMDMKTVSSAVDWVCRQRLAANPLTIVWHAGEPLTLPPEWYESAIAEAARAVSGPTRIEHRLQTNATLIDDRWCALFAMCNVRVGVSLDGPVWLHDARRRCRNGRGPTPQPCAVFMRFNATAFHFMLFA